MSAIVGMGTGVGGLALNVQSRRDLRRERAAEAEAKADAEEKADDWRDGRYM